MPSVRGFKNNSNSIVIVIGGNLLNLINDIHEKILKLILHLMLKYWMFSFKIVKQEKEPILTTFHQ